MKPPQKEPKTVTMGMGVSKLMSHCGPTCTEIPKLDLSVAKLYFKHYLDNLLSYQLFG